MGSNPDRSTMGATPLQDVLVTLGHPQGAAASGTAAALTAAIAASLLTRVARATRPAWDEAGGIVAASVSAGAQLLALADENVDAYRYARATLVRTEPTRSALGGPTGPGARPLEGGEETQARSDALLESAAVPAAIADLAAHVAALACDLEPHAPPDQRPDARVAARLAAGACAGAAHLVSINRLLEPEHPLVTGAQEAVRSATAALGEAP
jgi:formiminotetrahydrofolate cyclodeaminase